MSTNQAPYVTIKRIIKIAFTLVALSLLAFAFIPEKQKVDMFTIETGDITIALEGEGKTRIHDIYTISTPIDGRVTRIESNAGDIVTAGTIIANMYPANPNFLDKRSETQAQADVDGANAALALANSRVRQAQAQLTLDKSEHKRTQELFSNNMVSEAALEKAHIRLTVQQAELETAIANKNLMASRLKAAQAKLLQPINVENHVNDTCQICIHSPVDGRVLRILHKSESIVPVGTPLVEIGDPKDLEVIIEMLSTNAVQVQVGDEALIKRWGGKTDINARVKVIEPSGFTKISALGVEEQRVNVILSFTDPMESWQSLGDAFRVEAAIIVDKAQNVIKVPLSALFRENEVWSVFKVEDGTITTQTVTIGKRNDRYAEITTGLKQGEQIILHPSNKLTEGTSVVQR